MITCFCKVYKEEGLLAREALQSYVTQSRRDILYHIILDKIKSQVWPHSRGKGLQKMWIQVMGSTRIALECVHPPPYALLHVPRLAVQPICLQSYQGCHMWLCIHLTARHPNFTHSCVVYHLCNRTQQLCQFHHSFQNNALWLSVYFSLSSLYWKILEVRGWNFYFYVSSIPGAKQMFIR